MSLAVDGVWKAGVWTATVWADGVWSEGAVSVVVGVAGGGIGHNRKKDRVRKPEIAVITVDGQDYRVPIKDVPAFLERMKEEAVSPEPDTPKKSVKTKKSAYIWPAITVKEVPQEFKFQLDSQVERINAEIMDKISAGLASHLSKKERKRLRELDEEDIEMLLLAA